MITIIANFFATTAVAIYNAAPIIALVIIALTVLNGVRLFARSWRKQRWIQRQAVTAKKNDPMNRMFTMLEKI